MTHTAGPWTHEKTSMGSGGCIIGFPDGSGFLAALSEDDACLIAAAPDLLSLVFQYRSDLRHPPGADSVQRRLDAIEAVIAKATR